MAPKEPLFEDKQEDSIVCRCFDSVDNCDAALADVYGQQSTTCQCRSQLNAVKFRNKQCHDDDLVNWKTVSWQQLPSWLQGTPYLLKGSPLDLLVVRECSTDLVRLAGHRPQLESVSIAFQSVFRWHSETINIWTHGVGVIFFFGMNALILHVANRD